MKKDLKLLLVGADLVDAQKIESKFNIDYFPSIILIDTFEEYEKALESNYVDAILLNAELVKFNPADALLTHQIKSPLIPLIFYAEKVDEKTAITYLKSGLDEFLIKHDFERILPTTENVIKKKKLELYKTKAAQELRECKETFFNIYNNSVIAIYILNENGKFININKAASQILNLNPSLLHEKNIDDIAASDKNDINKIHEYIRKSFKGESQQFEFWIKSGNGDIIPQQIFTQAGKFYAEDAVIAYATDISLIKKYEQQIIISEQKYKSFFEQTNVAKSITLPNGEINPNQAFCELLGYSKDELKNKTWMDITPTEDIASVKNLINPLLKGEKDKIRFVKRYIHKYGNIIWTDLSSRLIRDESGNPVYFISTLIDITEKKKLEKILVKNNERLNKIMEINDYDSSSIQKFLDFSLQKAIELTDSKIGYIYFYNEEKEEFVLNSWSKDVMPECKIVNPQTRYQLANTGIWGEVVRQRKEILLNDFEAHNSLKKGYPNGHVKLKKYLSLPIFDDGKIVAVIGVANKTQDYDEEDSLQLKLLMNSVWKIVKRREVELENLKLINAVEHSPLSIIITNNLGNIEYVNSKFIETTGYDFNFVLGKNPKILKSGIHSGEFYKNLWDTISSGKEWKGEFYNRKKSGELYWESAAISPIFNRNNTITHFVAVKEDITEKKMMYEELVKAKEDATKADKLKSIFLAQISHEIRTPINSLLGNISLIRDYGPKEFIDSMKDVFKSIDSASRRLIRTIDLILNISELQTGSFQPIISEIDIDRVILLPMINEFSSIASLKKIELKYEYIAKSSIINGDFYSVQQIFMNLIDNAIKYTEKGSVSVIVYNTDDDKVAVEIQDTGIGMSPEFMPNLFSYFSQEEMGYNRKYEGNGLGLSLVKKYCEINNAILSVTSKKNFGSTFRVVFNS